VLHYYHLICSFYVTSIIFLCYNLTILIILYRISISYPYFFIKTNCAHIVQVCVLPWLFIYLVCSLDLLQSYPFFYTTDNLYSCLQVLVSLLMTLNLKLLNLRWTLFVIEQTTMIYGWPIVLLIFLKFWGGANFLKFLKTHPNFKRFPNHPQKCMLRNCFNCMLNNTRFHTS